MCELHQDDNCDCCLRLFSLVNLSRKAQLSFYCSMFWHVLRVFDLGTGCSFFFIFMLNRYARHPA